MTQHSSADIQSLLVILRSDITELEQLSKLLRSERDFLENGELDKFLEAGQRKIPALEQIESNAASKSAWLKMNNLSIERFRSIAGERVPRALEMLTRAEALLAEVAGLNRTNQKIIHLSQQRTEKIMEILRGGQSRPTLYGAGKRPPAPSTGQGQAIASA